MHPLELNREDQRDVLQLQHRYEYLLDGDTVEQTHPWHRAERQELELQRQEVDLLRRHRLIRQSVDLRQSARIDRGRQDDEIR